MSRQPDKLRSRIKQLLGIKSSPSDSRSPQLPLASTEQPVFCDELLKEIGRENSQGSRARILKELCEVVAAKHLEEHAIEALWLAVEDLLHPDIPTDVRQITLQFLTSLVLGQYGTLKLLRAHFFRVLQDHNIPEDLTHRLNFLRALTAEGKEILYFEEQIGPFLLSWMPDVISGEKTDIFLPLLRNVIRYNASYLDEEVVSGLVKQTCQMSNTTDKETDLEHSLAVLDAVVRYSYLPSTALYLFVVAVCNTVNVEKFCEPSWKLMRHLLGTHLGHNGVLTMCCILEDSNNCENHTLLRGAIFFVGMCLWGSKRVTSIKHKPIAVLPSFYKVLSCGNENVICEVTLSMQRLVKKYGSYQHVVAWESILDITAVLQKYVERHPAPNTVFDNFHILVSYIEELYEKHEFHGSSDKLFDIVERCISQRPESSVILLVSHRAQSLHPYCDNWFGNIKDLMEKYFKTEERTLVRIKVLDVLSNVLGTFSHLFEEEILEHSVLPYLDDIANDQDIAVRTRAVQLLVDIIEVSDSQKSTDVLNIIEKVAECPVDTLKRDVKPCQHAQNTDQPQDEKALEDIKEAVLGLVRLFKVKLFRQPQAHGGRIFNILVSHIKAHYVNGYRTYIASQIRLAILKCLLSLRADSCRRLGIVQDPDGDIKFSSYFVCAERKSSSDEKTFQSSVASIPYSEAMHVILICLQQEWEWEVLDVVLRIFPETLQDKNLILSGKQYLNSVCSVLSKMVSNYDFLPGLCNVPNDMRRLNLYARIFPVLTELSTYHLFIDQEQQSCLVRTMEIGLVSSSAALCVSCLTICMLEIPHVMTCLLPTFLQCFVKISPTPQVALPLLEFLSALSHLRELYTNFTTEQFKCVFGICLPYTNSSRFSQYTVTLAHHVVGSWYVHCPLPLRKQFVTYIIKNLKEPDMSCFTPPPFLMIPISPKKTQLPPSLPQNITDTAGEDSLGSLSSEMVEIAVDMMARYTFSSSLTQPKRSAVVEQLLANGTSRSWLLGNVLVTVTVSGRSPGNVLCPYCFPGVPSFGKTADSKESGSAALSTTGDYTKPLPPCKTRSLDRDCLTHSSRSLKRDELTGKVAKTDEAGNADEAGTYQRANPAGNLASETRSGTSSAEANTSKARGIPEGSKAQDVTKKDLSPSDHCSCVCQGWAELLVRRPTGNTSWILRLQNHPKLTGSFSSTQGVTSHVCPQIYESVIPKAFFDELTTDLEEELKNKQTMACNVRIISKSEDSDTLIVDLLKNDMATEDSQQKIEDDYNTGDHAKESLDDKQIETDVTHDRTQNTDISSGQENKTDITEQDNSAPTVKFQHVIDEKILPSERFNLASSFLERTRLLSCSPMDGPSAFMLLETSAGQKLETQPESTAEGHEDDVTCKRDFEKPIVGKSPLDASPMKYRLYQDDSDEVKEWNIDASIDKEESDHESPYSRNLDSSSSLPGSRTQSPLTGLTNRCRRISEASGGSSSLPTSPCVSPKRREPIDELSSGQPGRKHSRHEDRLSGGRTAPVGNRRWSIGVSIRNGSTTKKSATVDLGMLRRISSSPEMGVPVKEKRGLMKFFAADVVGDKDEMTKKSMVVLRRQTVSDTQLPDMRKQKRRSYNGPFPSSAGLEQEAERATTGSDVLSPNFIFLQFYHSSWFGEDEVPLALPEQQFFFRAVKNLDRIPAYDTHKIGVIYVGANQEDDEVAILRNLYGSSRYMHFLSGLGELVRLKDCSLSEFYTGGLDRNGEDGEYACNWRSEIAQIIFHVATLMPNTEKDPNCHLKKRHIGNDFVTIVYNDSKAKYNMGTIKGQFNFVEIVIKPLDNDSNVITVSIKEELKDILTDTNRGPRVISDKNLATLVRHIALHVNMASVMHQSQKTLSDAYGCNWLQRLRQIKRIQSRATCAAESQTATGSASRRTQNNGRANIVDFTEYILQ